VTKSVLISFDRRKKIIPVSCTSNHVWNCKE